MAQAVSDLSAADAPSLALWNQLSAGYNACEVVCATVVCIGIQGRNPKLLRTGVYLFAVMEWISAIGYRMFPLSSSGYAGAFQDVMHMAVTAAVVLLSIVSLTVIIGRTTTFILDHPEADGAVETALAATALVICLVQFRFGRWLGRRYGDAVAGGQSLGQKNTVLAVWMAQSFLDPISSVAPTAYIVWQNFVNSYQLWRKESGGDRPADPNE